MSVAQEVSILEQGNVKVTNLRVIIGAKTYALSNITSVELGRADQSSCGPVVAIFAGLGILAWGVMSLIAKDWGSAAAGILFGVLFVWGGLAVSRSAKPTYSVKVGSASGESNILQSPDLATIQTIVNAINEAIIRKG